MTILAILLQISGIFVARVHSDGYVVTRSDVRIADGGLQPSISPDGTKVAYWRQGVGDTNANIYLWDEADGSTTRLTDDAVGYESPQWSDDGTKIAYARAAAIYYMDADGGNKTLVRDTGVNARPMWVGNDSLMFTVDNYTGDDEDNIVVIHINGSGIRQITDGYDRDFKIAINPSGDRLAWHTREDPGDRNTLAVCTYLAGACTGYSIPLPKPSGSDYLHGPFWLDDGRLVVHGDFLGGTNEWEFVWSSFPGAYQWRPYSVPGFSAWNHMSFSSDRSRAAFLGTRNAYSTQAGTPHGAPRRAGFIH